MSPSSEMPTLVPDLTRDRPISRMVMPLTSGGKTWRAGGAARRCWKGSKGRASAHQAADWRAAPVRKWYACFGASSFRSGAQTQDGRGLVAKAGAHLADHLGRGEGEDEDQDAANQDGAQALAISLVKAVGSARPSADTARLKRGGRGRGEVRLASRRSAAG
jgi:hypothetical protein